MRAENMKVGQAYLCQVGKNSVRVTLVAVSPKGQMTVQSAVTGKKFQVADASRLSMAPGGTPQAAHGAPEKAATPKSTKSASGRNVGQRGASQSEESQKAGKPSLLNQAAGVVKESGQPMSAKAMVEAVLAKGTWATKGKTPEATLYAAIIREIAKKGSEARFRKVERGQFALNA